MLTCRMFVAALIASSLTAAGGAAAGAEASLDASPNGSWTLVPGLSDEFNGTSVDWSKWRSRNDCKVGLAWCWSPGQASVSGGSLQLTMTRVPEGLPAGCDPDGNGAPKCRYFKSGHIRSDQGAQWYQKHGMFIARIKGANQDRGVSSAFWLDRNQVTENGKHTEIDIVETNLNSDQPRNLSHARHIWKHPGPPPVDRHKAEPFGWTSPFNPKDAYHIYKLYWNGDIMRWYVDGQLKRQMPTQPYFDQAMMMLLQLGLSDPAYGPPVGQPATMKVDWVHVYKWTNG